MEVFFIIWLCFGIAAAIAAVGKGRSGCGWFLLGFLLGPFGLLFVWLASDKRPHHAGGPINPDECKKCPYCAETIQAAAIKCRYCGEELGSSIVNPEDVPMSPEVPPQEDVDSTVLWIIGVIVFVVIAAVIAKELI